MFYRPGASTGRKLNKSRRRVGATGAAIGLAAALTVTGATSATADVEELPPLVYSSHNFNDLEWEVSRKAPAVFEPGTDSLLIEVDRTDRGGTPYSWQEGMVADLPPTVDADGDRDIVSVRATVYVDPAWENIETSADRSGFDTSFEAGLWLSVPYHPSYPGQSAWPTVLLRNDHRTTENVPVANVFDTTNREDPLLTEDPISVAYGDQVTLEIRFDRETYTYYYFANDELIFEHEWWEDSGFPLEQIYFFTFNSGMPEDDDDDDVATSVQVQWSNLEFGTEAYPAAINDETVPDGTVGVAYSHAFDIDSEIDFTATASELPNGLELSADGVLSGTPTTAGSHTFTVAVDNGARPQEGVDSEREYTIEIAEGAFEGDVEYEFEFDGDQAVVGGSVTLGQIGQLTPTPDSVTFQWFRDGAPIEGATSDSYTFTDEDAGSTIHAVVTLSSESYEDVVIVVDGLEPVVEAEPGPTEPEPTEPEPTDPESAEDPTDTAEQGDLPSTGAPSSLVAMGIGALLLMAMGGFAVMRGRASTRSARA